MIDVLYGMEEIALNSFVQFKSDLDKLKSTLTPDLIDKVKASIQEIELQSGQKFFIEDGIAKIPVSGTLTPRAEVCVSLTDGSQTLYSSILESIKMADNDSMVKETHFIFDSPGGYMSGWENAALAIRKSEKKTVAIVTGMCASAAYGLASQCDEIRADVLSSKFGSIGILIELIDRSKQEKDMGIKRYVLTSSNAPNKFPDIGTQTGRDKIISMLNDTEEVFIQRIAEGRGVDSDTIKKTYGRGSVFTAKKALALGMIDGIINGEIKIKTGKQKTTLTPEINKMSVLTDLLEKDPEAKAEHDALIAAGKVVPEIKDEKAVLIPAVLESKGLSKEDKEFAKGYLNNKDYSALGSLAADVISGDADIAALKASVATVDQINESNKSEAAKTETEKQPETISADIAKGDVVEKQIENKALEYMGITVGA